MKAVIQAPVNQVNKELLGNVLQHSFSVQKNLRKEIRFSEN